MKNVQKGFTLIELMIVVAIIGILAAVAIPAYQDYVVKAKLSKVQSTLDPLKLALAMYNQENGDFPVAAATTVTAPGNGAVTTGDVWSSIGLAKTPSLPGEVSKIVYTHTAVGSATTLDLYLTGIKALTIDGNFVTMTPTAGATAVTWANTCTVASPGTSIDAIMKKYFNCP